MMKFDTPDNLILSVKTQLPLLYKLPEKFGVSLLKYSENIIYKISFEYADPLVFRLRRAGYHTDEELKSELIWTEELRRETDIAVPEIIRGRNGEIMQILTSNESGIDYRCDLMSFMYGNVIGADDGSIEPEKMLQIGKITAIMHRQSVCRDKSVKLVRKTWDVQDFFGKNAVWGSWRDYKLLSDEDIPILESAQQIICHRLESYGRTADTYGIIHADLHPFNIIENKGTFQVIDFDDCGFGFYLYDLGCTLVTCSDNLDILTDTWIKGYEEIRKLSKKDKSMLSTFVLLRRMLRLSWLSTHADSDTAKIVSPHYYEKTVYMARNYIKTQGD